MSQMLTIEITNHASSKMHFYAVQQPAAFTSAGSSMSASSSCLATGAVQPHHTSGTTLTFQFGQHPYVAASSNQAKYLTLAKTQLTPSAAFATVGADWPITLTPDDTTQQVPNNTQLSVSSLGLTKPSYDGGIPKGNFGVTVPSYTPSGGLQLYCGNGILAGQSQVILSSFVAPMPVSHIFCEPTPKFYVKVGNNAVGSVVPFSKTDAALCDFSTGFDTCKVVYKSDGTFAVQQK